jgi:hypothetical protein
MKRNLFGSRKVLLFEEELEEELVEAGEEVPVDVARVVAGDVPAVVGKLDGLAAFFRASLALQLPAEDLAAGDVELPETSHQRRLEQLVEVLGTLDVGGSLHEMLWTMEQQPNHLPCEKLVCRQDQTTARRLCLLTTSSEGMTRNRTLL